jgi:DNA-binding MarR family transcriptional regulator
MVDESRPPAGKSLQVATAIWHIASMKRSRTVQLQRRILEELGVNRKSVYRMLKALEREKLIACERGIGKRPTITILEVLVESNGNGKKGGRAVLSA